MLRRNDANGTERAGDGLDFEYFESNLQIQQNYLDMIKKGTPSGRLTTPEDIAQLIVFLGSKANGNINGQTVLISGGR